MDQFSDQLAVNYFFQLNILLSDHNARNPLRENKMTNGQISNDHKNSVFMAPSSSIHIFLKKR